ncbi:hypothetical protein OAU50_00955 [Planctomycetota bacterium]|nr:hypothetical protein [Planctomycetota bacterium]
MRYIFCISMLASLTLLGCKREFWTIGDWGETNTAVQTTEQGEQPKPVDPAPIETPEETPQTSKEIIYVLGVDGMD